MHGEVYIFGIKVISRLIGLTYENIAKMANKIFNVPNHLKSHSTSNLNLRPIHDCLTESCIIFSLAGSQAYRIPVGVRSFIPSFLPSPLSFCFKTLLLPGFQCYNHFFGLI